MIEPKLRNMSENKLAAFLRKMGCSNTERVLRRRGWSFPTLAECRQEWANRYPNWKWRDEAITEWQPEDGSFEEEFMPAQFKEPNF
jgi:hypothetical protein